MKRTITLYFVRHGQALHNVAAEKYGDYAYFDPVYTDSNLTEHGIKQATDLQLFFSKNNPDIVFSSPLRRCLQTLDHALLHYKKEIHVDDRLVERLGEHPCNKRSHKHEVKNHINRNLITDHVSDDHHWKNHRESDEDIICRGREWYEQLVNYLNKNRDVTKVAIFSHYDFLTTILSKGLPISCEELGKPFNNCEVREIDLYL